MANQLYGYTAGTYGAAGTTSIYTPRSVAESYLSGDASLLGTYLRYLSALYPPHPPSHLPCSTTPTTTRPGFPACPSPPLRTRMPPLVWMWGPQLPLYAGLKRTSAEWRMSVRTTQTNFWSGRSKPVQRESWSDGLPNEEKPERTPSFLSFSSSGPTKSTEEYFLDSLECARPFMAGGLKDLVPSIEKNFDIGKVYPILYVVKAFSEYIPARVRIVHRNRHLDSLVIVYLEDRNELEKPLVLANHSRVVYDIRHIVIRVPTPL
ncbi:hypothetical protein OROHE_027090 [Orobanche hederae]